VYCCTSLRQQLGDIRRDPSRLIFGEELRSLSLPAMFVLLVEVDVGGDLVQ